LDDGDVWVLPVGITGTEALFPIGATSIQRVRVTARAGRPFRAADLRRSGGGDRRTMADAIGVAIASLLPASYRGVYGDNATDLEQARDVWRAL